MEYGYGNRRSSRSSDDEGKSLSSSLSEGTSKFFNSVMSKKNGIFSDISNKIETTFSMKSGGSSSASSGNTSPVNSPPIPSQCTQSPTAHKSPPVRTNSVNTPPPPRPPPPTRRPSEKCFQKRHLPPRSMSESVGRRESADRGSMEDPITVNGMNVSFDEPLYNKREAPVGRSSDSAEARHSRESSRRVGPTGGNSADSRDNSAQRQKDRYTRRQNNLSSSSNESDKPNERSDGKRAPKLKTGRRSSTVDEMLFDNYVPPDITDIPSEPISGDLMSFDQSEDRKENRRKKTSPHPSQSSIDSNESNRLYTNTSIDSSDAEYGGVPVHRSGSLGSDKSWSSNYSIDSQPDEVTLECMEFMKSFVDKVFNTSDDVTQTEKAKFGELCQYSPGRLWFARYVNSQTVKMELKCFLFSEGMKSGTIKIMVAA
ncbi:hypothetical protein LOTGIDRAFT_159107 [Lottia gigantea]|uniref:Uncharacterized protein n=1 Tax=Lottia gigantea TaxID=225164 RepID=V4AMC5_LOTGI|nr:hypothetical protein LOTGIDRAFT_159107 [Lottia gigantea]ESO98307.1 hypothetical protein LOTGIDRAFT_159107 [Lottia gigantea]